MSEQDVMGIEELRERLAELDPKLSKAQARRLADGLLELIAEALAGGRGVTVPGFGSWRLAQAAPRAGTGPYGRPYAVPARRVVHFRPAQALARRVAGE